MRKIDGRMVSVSLHLRVNYNTSCDYVIAKIILTLRIIKKILDI